MAGGGGPAEQGTPDSRKSLRIRNLPPDHQVVDSEPPQPRRPQPPKAKAKAAKGAAPARAGGPAKGRASGGVMGPFQIPRKVAEAAPVRAAAAARTMRAAPKARPPPAGQLQPPAKRALTEAEYAGDAGDADLGACIAGLAVAKDDLLRAGSSQPAPAAELDASDAAGVTNVVTRGAPPDGAQEEGTGFPGLSDAQAGSSPPGGSRSSPRSRRGSVAIKHISHKIIDMTDKYWNDPQLGFPLTYLAIRALDSVEAAAEGKHLEKGYTTLMMDPKFDYVAVEGQPPQLRTKHPARDRSYGFPWFSSCRKEGETRLRDHFINHLNDDTAGIDTYLRAKVRDDFKTELTDGFRISPGAFVAWVKTFISKAPRPTQRLDGVGSGGDPDGEHGTGEPAIANRQRYILHRADYYRRDHRVGLEPEPRPEPRRAQGEDGAQLPLLVAPGIAGTPAGVEAGVINEALGRKSRTKSTAGEQQQQQPPPAGKQPIRTGSNNIIDRVGDSLIRALQQQQPPPPPPAAADAGLAEMFKATMAQNRN